MSTPMSKDFSEKFESLSLSELEAITGVDRATWSKYKNGKISPTITTVVSLAELLGVEPIDLASWFIDRRQ